MSFPVRPALLALAALAFVPPALPADIERGRALYELHCDSCHSESVHGRPKRAARDFEDVRGWVQRWNRNRLLMWSEEEVEDVTVFLNETYYRFACPRDACRLISLARPPR